MAQVWLKKVYVPVRCDRNNNMADKKQQQKEQLRTRSKAAQRNKKSVALEKAQKGAGRTTVKMISKARESKDPNYDQLVKKYKTQEPLGKFLDKERTRKSKEALANEKKRTGKKKKDTIPTMKKGGKVRGCGVAKQGVRKAKMR